MGCIGQGVKTLNGVDYIMLDTPSHSAWSESRIAQHFSAVYEPQGSRTSPNTAETSVSGALEPEPEAEIWRRPVFPTQRPRLVLRSKVGQSTQPLPV